MNCCLFACAGVAFGSLCFVLLSPDAHLAAVGPAAAEVARAVSRERAALESPARPR